VYFEEGPKATPEEVHSSLAEVFGSRVMLVVDEMLESRGHIPVSVPTLSRCQGLLQSGDTRQPARSTVWYNQCMVVNC